MPKTSFYAVLSKAEALYQLIHGFHVDGGPGQPGPVISKNVAQIYLADVLRDMAPHIRDSKTKSRVSGLATTAVRSGSAGLVTESANEGPPWLDLPWPLPWPPKKFDPLNSTFTGLDTKLIDKIGLSVAEKLAETINRLPK